MKDKKMNDKKEPLLGIEYESMSISQCETALGELMAELEAIEKSEPKLKVEEADIGENKKAAANGAMGLKELDGKKGESDVAFAFTLTDLPEEGEDETTIGEVINSADDIFEDELFFTAARLVVEEGVASVSFLQRSLKIGFDRAAEIVERLEKLAIISPVDGNRPRKILVSAEKLEKILSEQ